MPLKLPQDLFGSTALPGVEAIDPSLMAPRAKKEPNAWRKMLDGLIEEVSGYERRQLANREMSDREMNTGLRGEDVSLRQRAYGDERADKADDKAKFSQLLGDTPDPVTRLMLRAGQAPSDRQSYMTPEGVAADHARQLTNLRQIETTKADASAAPYGPQGLRTLGSLAEIKARGDQEIRVEGAKPQGSQGLTPQSQAVMLQRLQTQWDNANKQYYELNRQSANIESGMAAVRAGNKAAGAQTVLVTFQKLLDPTSVVRESEYARSAAGQAVLAQLEGFYDKLRSGGAGVPDEELQKFADMAKAFVQNSTVGIGGLRKRISAQAQEYGIKENLIFTNDVGMEQPAAPSGPKVGERRTFNGQLAEWDGKGWVAK